MKGAKTVIIYKKSGGMLYADGDVMEAARNIIAKDCTGIVVSTGLIIDAVRVMLATGEISVDEVEFQFDGKVLIHGQDGRFVDWPEGYNDTIKSLLVQL